VIKKGDMNLQVYRELTTLLDNSYSDKDLYENIVNAPFKYKVDMAMIFLGIIVLLILDPETQTVDRIALSDTSHANAATYVSVKDFKSIHIPYADKENVIVKTIKTSKPHHTTDWVDLFVPVLNADEARLNQASSGIAISSVYPITGNGKKGALIYSYYQYPENIGKNQQNFMKKYSNIVSSSISRFSK
jgi:hypothetical protein